MAATGWGGGNGESEGRPTPLRSKVWFLEIFFWFWQSVGFAIEFRAALTGHRHPCGMGPLENLSAPADLSLCLTGGQGKHVPIMTAGVAPFW